MSKLRDVIIASGVSYIYVIGSLQDYLNMIISLRPGMEKDRDEVIRELFDNHYDRNEVDFHHGTFRVRGDVLKIFPAVYSETVIVLLRS